MPAIVGALLCGGRKELGRKRGREEKKRKARGREGENLRERRMDMKECEEEEKEDGGREGRRGIGEKERKDGGT